MKLKANNIKYNPLSKKIFFDSEDTEYEMEAKDVLDLAYGMLDLLGMSYDILDDADYELNGGN